MIVSCPLQMKKDLEAKTKRFALSIVELVGKTTSL
jgi:hypothetical protein